MGGYRPDLLTATLDLAGPFVPVLATSCQARAARYNVIAPEKVVFSLRLRGLSEPSRLTSNPPVSW